MERRDPPGPVRFDRRLGGVLVLIVGVLAMLIVPRVLDAGAAGSATRAPAPGPPDLGSCVLWPTYEVVDCALPHSAEVTQTWTADDLDRPHPLTGCNSDLATYLGFRPAGISQGWHLPSTDFVSPEGLSPASLVTFPAPQRERLGGPGWLACAAYTVNPPNTVSGRLADLMVPVNTGSCFAGVGMDNQIPCTQDHRMELLGTLTLITGTNDEMRWGRASVPEFPTRTAAQSECELIAQDLLAVADPTFGSLVQVATDYQVGRADFSGDDDGASMLVVSCYLLASPELLLTDSLVGIANNPLPIR